MKSPAQQVFWKISRHYTFIMKAISGTCNTEGEITHFDSEFKKDDLPSRLVLIYLWENKKLFLTNILMAVLKLKWNVMDLRKICGYGLFSSTILAVLRVFFFLVEMVRILYDCNSFLCIGVCQSLEWETRILPSREGRTFWDCLSQTKPMP